MAAPQSYNFFGLGPGQMDASQAPALLAQQMALQEYNNPTSSQTQGGSSGGISPKMLGDMMMNKGNDSSPTGVPADVMAQGIPGNAQSWHIGAGPLPWQQPALPWSGS